MKLKRVICGPHTSTSARYPGSGLCSGLMVCQVSHFGTRLEIFWSAHNKDIAICCYLARQCPVSLSFVTGTQQPTSRDKLASCPRKSESWTPVMENELCAADLRFPGVQVRALNSIYAVMLIRMQEQVLEPDKWARPGNRYTRFCTLSAGWRISGRDPCTAPLRVVQRAARLSHDGAYSESSDTAEVCIRTGTRCGIFGSQGSVGPVDRRI